MHGAFYLEQTRYFVVWMDAACSAWFIELNFCCSFFSLHIFIYVLIDCDQSLFCVRCFWFTIHRWPYARPFDQFLNRVSCFFPSITTNALRNMIDQCSEFSGVERPRPLARCILTSHRAHRMWFLLSTLLMCKRVCVCLQCVWIKKQRERKECSNTMYT